MRKILSLILLYMAIAFAVIHETESITLAAESPQSYDAVVYGGSS